MKDDPMRGAFAALVMATMHSMTEAQREQFHNALGSTAAAALDSGQPKTAELIRWLERSAQFSRKHLAEKPPLH